MTPQLTCMEVGLHFNYGWDVDWCLDLCDFGGGLFSLFLGGWSEFYITFLLLFLKKKLKISIFFLFF